MVGGTLEIERECPTEENVIVSMDRHLSQNWWRWRRGSEVFESEVPESQISLGIEAW